MAKILITTIQVNFGVDFQFDATPKNSPELLLLKNLPLSDTTFDFTTFLMLTFLHGPHLFFTVWLVFD